MFRWWVGTDLQLIVPEKKSWLRPQVKPALLCVLLGWSPVGPTPALTWSVVQAFGSASNINIGNTSVNYVPANSILLGRALSMPGAPCVFPPSTRPPPQPILFVRATSLLHMMFGLRCPPPGHLARSCSPPVPSHLSAQALLEKMFIEVKSV